MADTSSIKDRLFTSVARRYQSHSFRDLQDYIFSNNLFQTFDDDYANFLFDSRKEISAYLSDPNEADLLVQYCIRSTRQYTHQRNQYINFTSQYDELVLVEYQDLLLQIKKLVESASSRDNLSETLSTILQRHHERLRLILASYCVAATQSDLQNNPFLQTVPCAEYSPRFQLQLLNIDLNQIQQPILDIGCGEKGNLVKFLREQGLDAFGLDRSAPNGDPFIQSDWFSFDYAQQKWGTVIAHQSLSTHFIFNYLNDFPVVYEYKNLFKRILSNLTPQGVLYYTPGLPFFESELQETSQYIINRKTIASNLLGLGEIAYAAQIKLR
jgi:hypothetical protein